MTLNKIYEENAVEILAVPDGVIIVSQEENFEDQAVVTFKYYSFRSKRLMSVTRDVYLRAKFGDSYQEISAQLPDYINYNVAQLPDGELLCVYPTGESYMFSVGGKLEWKGELKYKGFGPSGVACVGRSIWLSFAEGDTILRYNPRTMREELRIGSHSDDAFSRPCGLFCSDMGLIVCNTESRCVELVDTDNYTVDRIYNFNESVYRYIRSGVENIVLLESGVYVV